MRATGGRLGWTAIVAVCLLASGRLVAGQSEVKEGRITVTSPDSGDEIHAGDTIVVAFNVSGDGVFGPYAIDLYKGNYFVQAWCSESEGCAIDSVVEDGYGVVPVDISPTHEPDLGYSVRVTDRLYPSNFGSSFPFQLFPANFNSSEEASPEFREDVGGAAGVGDMGLAMVVVATVCGLALACTLLVSCCLACRRRATKKTKDLEAAVQDIELGRSADRTTSTPGRMNDSSSSGSRGLPVRSHSMGGGGGGGSGGGSQGQFTPARALRRGESSGHVYPSPSPAPAMAMGEHQRGRSLSRRSSPGRPRMYSSTPGRASGGTSASPGQQGSRRGTPGRRRGRQMYGRSGGPSWDEAGGGRPPSRSPGMSRSNSAGRLRRPPRSSSQEISSGEYVRGAEELMTMTPGRRRSAGGGDSSSRGYGRQDSSRSAGVRRTVSERYARSPSGHWVQQEQQYQQQESGSRWEDRDMAASAGEVERGRRSLSRRSGLGSGSTRSRSLRNSFEADRSLERSGSRSRSRSRSGPTTPSRQQGYRSGMADGGGEIPPDVSWEELRSTYIKNKARIAREGVRKSYSLPSYGDAVSDNSRPPPPSYGQTQVGLSIGIPDDSKPGPFRASKSARAARRTILSGPLRSARAASKSPGRFGAPSPGTRAVSARRAARDAQLSAERALAAAAMASRAADLAAQAALEAEAEADAELVDDHPYEEEVHMSPPSSGGGGGDAEASSSSVREKIKVFSGGNSLGGGSSNGGEKTPGRSPFSGSVPSLGWSQADEKLMKARAGQSSAKAKEALALFGSSTSGGGRPDNSWLKGEGDVRGPDTAGGSSQDGAAAAAESVAAAAPPDPESAHAPAPSPSDPGQLAMRRKAFVKHYSQSGASDANEDPELSPHDNAAAVAIAAALYGGRGTATNGDVYADPLLRQAAGGKNQGTPKRGRCPLPVDTDGNDDDERTRARRRPSPRASYTTTREAHSHSVGGPSVLTMSDSGSPRP